VVAASFSREGAEEIRRRLTKRIGEEAVVASGVQIGTFHALIAEHRKKNFRTEKMLSPAHQTRTLASAAREAGLSYTDVIATFEEIKYSLIPPNEAALPAWYKNYEQHLHTLHAIDLQDLIRASVLQMGMTVKLPAIDECDRNEDENTSQPMPQKLAYAVRRYKSELRARCEALKASAKAADIEGRPRDAEVARREMQQIIANEGALPLFTATHLIIDESQDNDQLQFALATLHAMSGVQTTLIGDDDQTIYEWRQAMGYPGLMSFAETFGARVITLGANFRSLRKIVDHADLLIRGNVGHRIEKVFEARRGAGGAVVLEKQKTNSDMFAVSYVMERTTEEPSADKRWLRQTRTGEIAILARSNKYLDSIERELTTQGIKYVRNGSSIFNREGAHHVYDILGGVYAADIKGISIMLQLMQVSTSTADRVCRMIKGREVDFVEGRMDNFAQFGADAEQVEQCSQWFSKQRNEAARSMHPEVIADATAKALSIYFADGKYIRTDESNAISVKAAQTALTRMRGPVLSRVMSLRNVDAKSNTDNAVMLMTFHGSKGLEFNQVIIVGADEKSVPGRGEIMSERRLFYVAVTRPKDALLITYAGQPSRYLVEMGLA
jgi:superfamily I DNA/RNA helicase